MKDSKPITSIDVAKYAGVSQSAVSRAFTPGAAVSDKTRAKVMEAAKALKYRPNAIARTLSTNRSHIIGMVLSQLDNLFYPTVVDTLSRALQQHGFHLMLFFAEGRDVDKALTQLLAYQLDGVVLASTTLSSRLAKECVNANIPVVMFNRSADGAQASSVTSNLGIKLRVTSFICVAAWNMLTNKPIAKAGNSNTARSKTVTSRASLPMWITDSGVMRFAF